MASSLWMGQGCSLQAEGRIKDKLQDGLSSLGQYMEDTGMMQPYFLWRIQIF